MNGKKTAGFLPRKGMTLMEIMVVVVIVGVIATISLPRFGLVVEKFRSEEGKKALRELWMAQKRYSLEHAGAYATSTGELDIDAGALTNFNAPTVQNNPAAVATIQRSGGGYTLTIDEDGAITCSGSPNCSKLGF